jgi:hypothetical protein
MSSGTPGFVYQHIGEEVVEGVVESRCSYLYPNLRRLTSGKHGGMEYLFREKRRTNRH